MSEDWVDDLPHEAPGLAAMARGRLAPLAPGELKLTQAMWDALGILGFDLDGDPTPAAVMGMGLDRYIEQFLHQIREARAGHDTAVDEVCMKPEAHTVTCAGACLLKLSVGAHEIDFSEVYEDGEAP